VDITTKEIQHVASVVGSGDDRDILRKMRDETTHLVLLVRLMNEERKSVIAAEKAAKEEKEKESDYANSLL
jgi:hypothetical protein